MADPDPLRRLSRSSVSWRAISVISLSSAIATHSVISTAPSAPRADYFLHNLDLARWMYAVWRHEPLNPGAYPTGPYSTAVTPV
jgi:hypothetical protein